MAHLITENQVQLAEQLVFVVGRKHRQGLPIDINHLNFVHAVLDKFRVHADEHAKVFNAPIACFVEQQFDTAQRVIHRLIGEIKFALPPMV